MNQADQHPIHVSGDILRDSRTSPANFAPILSMAAKEFERIDAYVAGLKNRLALELAKQKIGMYCSPTSLAEELQRETARLEASRLTLLGLRAIEEARDAQPPVPAPARSTKLTFDKQTGSMVEG